MFKSKSQIKKNKFHINHKSKNTSVKTEPNPPKMVCSPTCQYFPNMECNEWVYDDNVLFIKRRKEEKPYVCGYDGHIIKSWYAPCPQIEEKKNKRYIYD